MKKKTTPFAHPRADGVPRSGARLARPRDGEWGPGESHSAGRGGAAPSERPARSLNATSRTGAGYPSFAEILATSDLRTLVKRASARVFGPAVVAGAVGLSGCSSAADFYSDLIEPPPQAENPIEMHEMPKPSDPMPHVGPVGVEAMEPCPLPETPPDPVTPVETSMVNPPSHPPLAPGGIRPVQPSYAMPGGAG